MSFETLAGKGISSTYNRLVQTDGVYLADGTGSLINNLTVPGNLVVSGTLYAQNTVVVTQSFSSGSNILGDAVNDFQTLYGTVRIPTGSFIVSGSSTFVNPNTPYQVSLRSDTNKAWSLGVGKVGYFQDWFLINDGISDIVQINNSYTRVNNILTTPSSLGVGITIPAAKLHISGASSDNLLRIDSPATSSIIYVSGSGVIGFNQTSSLTSQATFRGISGNSYLTEINTTTNGAYGLRTDGPVKAAGYFFSNAGGGNILTAGGVSMMFFDSSLNVGIAVSSSVGARLHIRGAGTTSATNALLVQNANASSSLVVRDDGYVGIGTTTPSSSLDITSNGAHGLLLNTDSGNGAASSRLFFKNATTTFAQVVSGTSLLFNYGATVGVATGTTAMSYNTSGNVGIGNTPQAARLYVSGSPGTGSAVAIYKSGSNVLSIDGSSGRLFSVDDSLSGSLFSVNTAAGLPTIEAFSDNTVNIGKYNVYPIKVVSNGTAAAITGSFSGSIRATSITLTGSLNVSGSQNYVGDVNILGTLTATVKSFLIEHPTQPGKKLQYGNLEGPEHAVYFRGRSTSSIIEFPEEWAGLVNEETVTVQLTPIGGYQPLYVSNITSTRVEIQVAQPMALNYHYLIHGERKDIDKLITTVN